MFTLVASLASADLGPENTVLVVNSASADSIQLAEFYARRRGIAEVAIIRLVGVPDQRQVNVETFQSLILRPVLQQIVERGLSRQTRLIAYSAGFPTEIDIRKHTAGFDDAARKKIFTPVASLNGATYHFMHVTRDQPEYLNAAGNFYARATMRRSFDNPFAADREPFDLATQAFRQGDFEKAARGFRGLLRRDPQQHPIAVLAAQSAAAGGDIDQAAVDLMSAVKSGWWSRGYLEEDDDLAPVLRRPGMADVVATLPDGVLDWQPPVGFVGHRVWTPNGVSTDSGKGWNYLLSACLAVTGPGGLSVQEATEQLDRSINADGHPAPAVAKFLFSETRDVRTTTRQPAFPTAIKALAFHGCRAQTFDTPLPSHETQIAGLMLGTARFDWKASGCQLLPGAIAENLTSFGGRLDQNGQTTLIELLRAGAALSSGTVTEPYALQFKFPHPMMHPAYVEGLTAIEAMTSQLMCPYQLLIVGDPLCSPYRPAAEVQAEMQLDAAKKPVLIVRYDPREIDDPRNLEIYLDGVLKTIEPLPPSLSKTEPVRIQVNLENIDEQPHDLRVVLECDDLIGRRYAGTVEVSN